MDIKPASTGYVPEWSFGDRLRKARTSMGLDMVEFAALGDEGDFTFKMISNYERGLTIPKPMIVRELARISGVDYEWLATGKLPTGPEGPNGGLPASVTKLPGLDSNQEPIGERVSAKTSTFRTWGNSESDYARAA